MKCLALSGVLMLVGTTQAQKKAFGVPKIIKGARAFPGSVAVADFDLDGRKDVAVANAFVLDAGNGPATTYFLERDLEISRTLNLPVTREPGLYSYPAMATADLDRNGLEDIVLMSDRGALSVYLNQGPKDAELVAPRFRSAFEARRIPLMQSSANQFFFLRNSGFLIDDFDGDGHLDLALAGEMNFLSSVQGYTGVILLPGDGKGCFGKEKYLLVGPVISLAKGDVDGDGRMDLIALAADKNVYILRSLGQGKYAKTTWLCSSPVTPLILATGDADGDNNDDILIGGGDRGAEATVYYSGARQTWSQKTEIALAPASAARTESMFFGDIDGDGLADASLVLSRQWNDASLAIHKSTGTGFIFLEEHSLTSIIDPAERVPAHALLQGVDFDGDLNPELVVGSLVARGSQKLVQFVFPNNSPKKVGYRVYGRGYKTGADVIPAIATYGGRPALGNRHWGVAVSKTNQGGRRAALFFYHNAGGPWRGPGFTINVFPRWSIGTKTKGSGITGGYALVPLAIPKDPYLVGRTFHFQWLIEDPGAVASNGIAVSEAMSVTFVAR